MKKRLVIVFILIVVLAFFAHSENNISKVDLDVLSELKEIEEVRVFVNFEKGDKREVVNSINRDKIKFEFDDSVSVVLTEDEIKKLDKNPRVKSIELVGYSELFLSDSVPLVNGTIARSLKVDGLNLTGKGVGVCVIDSGIDYTHPDLGGCFGDGCKVVVGWDYCADDVVCNTQDADPIDVSGHGTHVAGIIAANGNVKGVAPESHLIAMKVCNASGSCADDAIQASIDWCVDNAEIYNISIISMSLGSSVFYSNYCDSSQLVTGFTSRINRAFGKNISVVIATGNSGETGYITSPSCVKNATRVGATYVRDIGYAAWIGLCTDETTYEDKVVCFSNRNSLVNLMAPGVLIYSSLTGGNFGTRSGTSMATPHVSGAIAVMTQYLKATNQTKTPYEIEMVLNSTGKRIPDSGSGLNFSRINVYDAVIAIDNQEPSVELIYPSNSYSNLSSSYTFRCNATDLSLSNVTFYLWNETSIVNQTTKSASGSFDIFELNVSGLNYGDYTWNCGYRDENNNLGFASQNFTLSILSIQTNLVFPEDNNYTNESYNEFVCESNSIVELSNMTFYLWNEDLVYNETKIISGLTNSTTFNFSFETEGEYLWSCRGYNSDSEFHTAENLSFFYDITTPNVSLILPEEGYSATGTTNVLFSYNVEDNFNVSYCSLLLNDVIVSSENVSDGENNFSYSVSPGDYNWKVNCWDKAGNIGISDSRNFVINSAPLGIVGGGGGGGGPNTSGIATTTTPQESNEFFASSDEIEIGYAKNLKENDKLFINLSSGSSHTLTINKIENNYVNLTIQSEPINFLVLIGGERKLDLNSDDYYDLSVRVQSIQNNSVNIIVTEIREKIDRGFSELFDGDEKDEKNNRVKKIYWIIVSAFILVIFVVVIILKSSIKFKKIDKKFNELKKVREHKNEVVGD